DAVREGLRTRFAGIPDVRYEEDRHFVSGDVGVSQWTLRGTSTKGERIEVRGCDFYTFRDGKIVKKDSFWKIREGESRDGVHLSGLLGRRRTAQQAQQQPPAIRQPADQAET